MASDGSNTSDGITSDGSNKGAGMSLGLPSHLARATNSRGLANAAHWAGLVCLAATLVNLGVLRAGHPFGTFAPAAIALVPMATLLILLNRRCTVPLTIAYLAVGAVCTFFYASTVLLATPTFINTNLFALSLPIVAMTMVGGAGSAALIGVLWATLGFALAELVIFVAAVVTDHGFRMDWGSLGAYLLLVTVLLVDGLTRGGRHLPQVTIHRAIREDQVIHIHHELSLESAADLHDTALSELITVANALPGPLAPALRRRIEADLHSLGQDRLPLSSSNPSGVVAEEIWLSSEMHAAIELARDDGLAIEVSGDRNALGRLSPETRRAIGLAVRQCLVNVLRHSGSPAADVAIAASESEVSVLVADSGRGYVQSDDHEDRLGLRNSVHDRIARVGGRVTIWSAPDVGTSVMLLVPTLDGRDVEVAL
jgi:signal transduction histidine kinase